jgi:hypothetical protein
MLFSLKVPVHPGCGEFNLISGGDSQVRASLAILSIPRDVWVPVILVISWSRQ